MLKTWLTSSQELVFTHACEATVHTSAPHVVQQVFSVSYKVQEKVETIQNKKGSVYNKFGLS